MTGAFNHRTSMAGEYSGVYYKVIMRIKNRLVNSWCRLMKNDWTLMVDDWRSVDDDRWLVVNDWWAVN